MWNYIFFGCIKVCRKNELIGSISESKLRLVETFLPRFRLSRQLSVKLCRYGSKSSRLSLSNMLWFITTCRSAGIKHLQIETLLKIANGKFMLVRSVTKGISCTLCDLSQWYEIIRNLPQNGKLFCCINMSNKIFDAKHILESERVRYKSM